MKETNRFRTLACLAALPWLASGSPGVAGSDDDPFDLHARAWALEVAREAPAWRLELTPEIYRTLADPDARDLRIVDADGVAMPMFRLPREALVEKIAETHPARFESRIPDPPGDEAPDAGLTLEIERPDGTRLRLAAPEPEPGPARMQPVFEALIETPRIQRPVAKFGLQLEWVLGDPADGPLECLLQDIDDPEGRYRVLEVKRRFRTMPARLQARADVPPRVRVWFVHCRAHQAAGDMQLERVLFHTRKEIDHNRSYRVEPPAESAGNGRWRLATQGPHAWQHLDVINRRPGQLASVELRYRDPVSGAWIRHATAELSTLNGADPGRVRFELSRHLPRGTSQWQVTSEPPLQGETRITLHARAEQWVFLSRGRRPGHLLAGSRRAEPADPDALARATLDRIGPAWQLPEAHPGESRPAAGPEALTPPRQPPDWKRIALWIVLLGGAAAVSILALRALREQDRQAS